MQNPFSFRSFLSFLVLLSSSACFADVSKVAPVSFAVIGDYGEPGPAEAEVAALVKSKHPDLILTTGDNNYPSGDASTIDANIGRYYHSFIFPYVGKSGDGAAQNRFFPSLGNHDWYTAGAQPYLDYFTLPGNERYYDFVRGPVHFFALDSDDHEPDGRNSQSAQGEWLKDRLARSTETWKVVYFHHPPFSSGDHGDQPIMQWPFRKWGVDVVLSGHDHDYERLKVDGLTYVVVGTGGARLYHFRPRRPITQARYNDDWGALFVQATEKTLRFQFVTRRHRVVDEFSLTK